MSRVNYSTAAPTTNGSRPRSNELSGLPSPFLPNDCYEKASFCSFLKLGTSDDRADSERPKPILKVLRNYAVCDEADEKISENVTGKVLQKPVGKLPDSTQFSARVWLRRED